MSDSTAVVPVWSMALVTSSLTPRTARSARSSQPQALSCPRTNWRADRALEDSGLRVGRSEQTGDIAERLADRHALIGDREPPHGLVVVGAPHLQYVEPALHLAADGHVV